MPERHHRIDYIELSATDLPRVQAFYGQVFGWTFTAYGPGYVGISTGGEREAGGFAKVDELPAPPAGSPLVILYSNELDATLRAVTEAGGTITTPPFDFPGGRRFHFRDTEGNVLAVWTELK
ncbi:MAG: VOC family protein [Myxococcota bacterium]